MSKERSLPLLGRPLRPALFLLGVLAVLLPAAFSLAGSADARIFAVSVVNRSASAFDDDDFDLFDAQIFPLSQSDGFPGNTGLQIDTFFAPTGSTVWFGIAAENGAGDLTIDSNEYGTFTQALCNDRSGDGNDFEEDDDNCASTEGLKTDRLIIDDTENDFDHVPLGFIPRMGVGVAFQCPTTPGTARILFGQQSFGFEFFLVCHGQLASAQLSATSTQLEIWPQPGSTAHSLIRLELSDALGGIVAGYEVEWSVDRCAIETDAVDNIDEALAALGGFIDIADSVAPDAVGQSDAARNIVHDFDGDGDLEAISLAILHCEPGHSPTSSPGPITIRARITKGDETPRIVTLTINLVGPPAAIILQASPTNVQCGEKITVTALVLDLLSQPVSDFTRVEFAVNLGGTGTAARIFGPIAPISSGIGSTTKGVATFLLLTSTANVGTYVVVAEVEGIFSTPPVVQTISVNCYVPTPTPAPSGAPAAATVVAPAAATTGIRPPNTGDAGLRR